MSAERMTASGSWIVLGDRDYGISYGPFTEDEAKQFAAQQPGRIALTLAGACSQIETCVAYGLPFQPAARDAALERGE